ncbi:MAG: SprB repeat-containing protein [Bacteroidia bacterium]
MSGNTFHVTVSFYRDCAGVAAPAITLNARSASCSKNQDYTPAFDPSTGYEITFPCRTVTTICTNASSTYAGYQFYRYEGDVTLPQKCTDWIFSFYVCCRNCAISTLNNPCSDNMYIEATLNNVAASNNNSPQFTNIPVAFFCVNQAQIYNHGVYDPDGDSLVYAFITPKTYNTSTGTTGTVTFKPGYSATNPLSSSPAVTLDAHTGDINMTPTVNGEIGVTAIRVTEYRNGVAIGSVIRDMQFLTRICNPNFLPTSTGINGTSVFNAVVCPGSNLNFTVSSGDPNATDTVTMTWNSSIPGATFNTVGAKLPVGTFNWTPTISDARSQPYSFVVTVRDNACPYAASQSYSFNITVPVITATVTSPTYNGYNVACRSGSTGSATATGGGGTSPYTFSWTPSGQTTQTAINLSSTTYTVTVTDASGCTKTATVNLTQPPTSVSSSIPASTNVSCNGGSDGSATATASGGISPYTYSWLPGSQTTSTASNLSANSYTVTVTDLNGCTSQQTVLITQPAILNGSISTFSNVTCNGNANGSITASASGGTAPYTHHWSNGATTATVTGLGPGTYRDTIRDAHNCQTIVSQIITQPGGALGIPSSTVSTTNAACFGSTNGTATVNPAGGTAPYSITWSNGDIGNTADSLAAGTYTVHIVDANLCTFDSTISITQPNALAGAFVNYGTTAFGTDIACHGDTTATVKISVSGGTAPYTYAWNTGATIDSVKNRGAGVYTVVTTDAHGCTRQDSYTVTEPTSIAHSLTVHNVQCKGESSGWIRTTVSGGAPAYTYSWAPGGTTADTLYYIPAGFFQVIVTDLNGCVVIDTVTITEPDTLVPLILPSTYIGAVNLSCYNNNSGSATVNVFGGTPPFIYLWSDGSTTVTANNLNAGGVEVHVVDANGCSIVRDTTLIQPTPFAYAPVIHDPGCYGDSSGFISLHTSGSTPPYTYAWSEGSTTDSVFHLPTGNYYVIVHDANGCRDSVNYLLSNPDVLQAPGIVSDYQGYGVSCTGSANGSIDLHVSGGDGNYTYTWSSSQTTDSITGLTSGNYTVTIFDGNGCRKDTTFVITAPPSIGTSLLANTYAGGVNVSCYGYADSKVFATVNGGVPPYTYLWSNGDVADSAVGLTAGTYTLTVTDSNGCVAVDSVTIVQPAPVTLAAVLSNYNGFNLPCNGDSSACIQITMTGGSAPFTFIWDGSDTITSLTRCGLSADTFSVAIMDANACMIDTSFILTEPQPFSFIDTIADYGGYQINCNGMTNGSINLTVNGGVQPFAYLWSTTDTTEDISGLGAGTYQVHITDLNGCQDSASYTLNEPPVLTHSITPVDPTCGQANGSATIAMGGGVPQYTYSWSGGASPTLATDTGLVGGTYYVTATDSVGCTVTDSVVINPVPGVSASISTLIDNTCFGNSTGSAQLSISTGIPPYVITWSNGDSGMNADSMAAGSYYVLIVDSNNCQDSVAFSVGQAAQFGFSYAVSNPYCNGTSNGSATVTITGGNAPYSVSWSNGDTGLTADSLTGGYTVVSVTDSLGCQITDSVNILQNTPISVPQPAINDVLCNGGANGSASVTPASGGIGTLIYSWSNGDTGLSADSLLAGPLTLTVTDSANCSVVLI